MPSQTPAVRTAAAARAQAARRRIRALRPRVSVGALLIRDVRRLEAEPVADLECLGEGGELPAHIHADHDLRILPGCAALAHDALHVLERPGLPVDDLLTVLV